MDDNELLDLSGMDIYGIRALMHVRKYCPTRFFSIPDPVSFFSSLGEQLRDQVMAEEEAIMGPVPPANQAWLETTGRWNMARLAAEDKVFAEMIYAEFPPEEEQDEAPTMADLPGLSPLSTDEDEDFI